MSVDERKGRPDARLCLLPLAVWTAWHVILIAAGARLSTEPLAFSWQLVPFDILKDDPLGSVWYLHIQPPLWNLTVGGVARWSPLSEALSLQLVLLACSGLTVVAFADLLRRMRFAGWVCVVAASVIALDPELVSYAYEPTYQLPTVVLVVAVVWCAVRLVEQPTVRLWLATSAVATALVMTRSIFHPLWLILFFALLYLLVRPRAQLRQVVACGAVPLILVGGWMVKNQALFGELTLSSWGGMNLQRVFLPPVPESELETMAASGTVSDVAAVGPFRSYADYAEAMAPCTPTHDHPAVADAERANGVPNFNYMCFLPVYRQAGEDAWAVARHRPGVWWEGRVWATRLSFGEGAGPALRGSGPFEVSQEAYRALTGAVHGTLAWEGWSLPLFGEGPLSVRFLPVLGVGFVVLIARGGLGAWRLGRGRCPWEDRPCEAGWLMAAGVSAYVLAVGIVAELGEQARFRALVEPFVLGLPLALLLSAVATGLRRVQHVGQERRVQAPRSQAPL